jgi:hypothetical protein
MSIEIISKACNAAQEGNYVWELYYFRVNRQRSNPYMTYKVRFKNDAYLVDYAKNLLNSIMCFQINQISDVQVYNGENTKISCDKLSLNDEIIKNNWDLLCGSIANPCEQKFKGNVQGYLLVGKPTSESGKSISFFKTGNPIIKLSDNKVHFYSCVKDTLELVTDEFCRLYLTTDFIVYDGTLYTFNLNFEKIFGIEKTMLRIKENGIEFISSIRVFSDVDMFRKYAREYRSPKTFINLNQERINIVQDLDKRSKVASMLGIKLDDGNNFIIDTADKASLFIRYLCYRIFKDEETKDVIEASNVSKLNLKN